MRRKRTLWSVCLIFAAVAAVMLFGIRSDDPDFPVSDIHRHTDDGLDQQSIQHCGLFAGNVLSEVCGRQSKGHTFRTAAVLFSAALYLPHYMMMRTGMLHLRMFLFSPLRYLFELSVLQRKDGKKRAVSFL